MVLNVYKINLNRASKEFSLLKEQIPDENQTAEIKKKFAKKIIDTGLETFNLKQKEINLSSNELLRLNSYLYATNLMIDCKKASVTVSQATWDTVENRMLKRPPRYNFQINLLLQKIRTFLNKIRS